MFGMVVVSKLPLNIDSEKNGINKKIKYLIIAFLTGKVLN